MRLRLTLTTSTKTPVIPVNYQYPLSAVIYKILGQADPEYAAFLHNIGYKLNTLKSFKLFTFSDIKTPFKIQGDRLHLMASTAELAISFHLPLAAETFIKGVFQNQQIIIADKKSNAAFYISQIESLPSALTDDSVQEIMLDPLSPVVCGLKNNRGNYDFLPPEHPAFISQLMFNWKEKYKVVHGPDATKVDFTGVAMEMLLVKPPRSRLITIKAATPEETKIRGFLNFRLKVRGKRQVLELLLDSGLGIYNSLGMGSVEVIKTENKTN